MTVRVHHMPFGATVTPAGVDFALWAPSARTVGLVLDGRDLPMNPTEDGWWQASLSDARAGSRYGFRIDGDAVVPDPASRFQPDDVGGPSAVVDPAAYRWRDAGWHGRPWNETVLYEVHVGTATTEGTFAALEARLEAIAALGITAIELMPLSDFVGTRNWGYDGVLPFAPDSRYGTPDELKHLVDHAHALGLMVFIDVVHNHFGPAGNHLARYAAPFFTDHHHTPWGDAINFDDAGSQVVRAFFIHNALYWIQEFHADGLRFDAAHTIRDDSRPHILAEIATKVRRAARHRIVHLVLENERNEARWLGRSGGRRLFDAQWSDDIHHAWHVILTGEREGYYADTADDPVEHLGRALAEGFAWQGEPSRQRDGAPRGEPSSHLPPTAFVAYLQNHDQVGNRAMGERLSALAAPERLALAHAVLLLAPHVPLLFMGEEWAASTPFQFFVDFADDPALSQAVRDGRQQEFAGFAGFGGDALPDPTAAETFRASTLRWAEAEAEPHAAVRAETQRLLALRRERVLPLSTTDFLGAMWARPTPDALDVTWRFVAGTLRLMLNFGNAALEYGVFPGHAVLWASPAAAVGDGAVALPPWTAAFFRGT
jgi:maltooligosyltrehalose trehalohydrolase